MTQTLRVLAVDDEPVNLLVYEQIIGLRGHTLVKAAGAAEALGFLETEAFDVVIMDIHMPWMSGHEVVRKIRMRPGPNRDVKVIAITADNTAGRAPFYIDRGFDDYIPKPVEVGALLDSLVERPTLGDKMKRRDVIRDWVREELDAGYRSRD